MKLKIPLSVVVNDLHVFSKTRVFSAISGFGDTGVRIVFAGVGSSEAPLKMAAVQVGKYDEAPVSPDSITESNVGKHRVVIQKYLGDRSPDERPDLDFSSDTEVRVDVGVLSGIEDPGNVTMYRRPARATAPFEKLETTYDAQANELVAKTDRLGEFTFASDTEPLPVELAAFEATTSGEEVRLTWTTASEQNNAGFEVQRRVASAPEVRESPEMWQWSTLGFIEGAGSASEPKSYQFTDEDLPYAADTLAYRLKQLDADGSAAFSDVVTVGRGVSELRLLGTYPNPTSRQTTLRYAVPDRQELTIRLYDALGRQVRTVVDGKRQGRQKTQLDTSTLPSGMYFLRLQVDGQTRTRKLTVVR